MRRLLVFIVCLLCASCGARPTVYRLTIADGFTSAQIQIIQIAAKEWRDAVPDLYLGAVDTQDMGEILVRPVDGCTLPDAGCLGMTYATENGGTVNVLTGNDLDTFHTTVLHELGHAMGLSHTGAGTIMCKAIECSSNYVTSQDATQWYAVHDAHNAHTGG